MGARGRSAPYALGVSDSLDRPTWLVRFVLPGAFVVALGCLVVEAVDPVSLVSLYGLLVGPVVLGLGFVASLRLLALAMRDPERAPRLRREALLVPCVLAPLAVVSPWVIAPSHFGDAYGSLPFFLAWLDRYPTALGVNHEVLLGIGAVLGSCALPAAMAFHVGTSRRPRPSVVIALAVLQLVAYVPVLLRLDADLLAYAGYVARGGPINVLVPVFQPWWDSVVTALSVGAGALLRALATLAMLALVPLSVRWARAPEPVWETA